MDAGICPSLENGTQTGFGRRHFGACDFGDKRLTDRAVLTGDALMRHPGGTLPEKLPRAQLCGFYDLANNVKVNHTNVLACHCAVTAQAARDCPGTVLYLHDTTEADFSGLDIADLGQIGNGGRRGLLIHNILAVNYQKHMAIGLMGQIPQARRMVKPNETVKARREHPQRESRLWIKGSLAVGRPPEGAVWVNVMDRGGDSFESLNCQHDLGQFYVVRSRYSRQVRVKDGAGRWQRRKLHVYARGLKSLGERTVVVAANANQVARVAIVRVAAAAVELQAPQLHSGEHGSEPLSAWIIHVKELSPPAGQMALEWFILTNRPTTTLEQAMERVDWYECRPMIEELHKAQKTGCGMELAQFTTRKALEITIAMLSVVAVQLLRLRDLSRQQEDAPAGDVVAEPYIEALSLWRWKQIRPHLTAKEFLHALARLGGHLGRPSDRLPGWLVLWRGWTELQRLVEGIELARLERSG